MNSVVAEVAYCMKFLPKNNGHSLLTVPYRDHGPQEEGGEAGIGHFASPSYQMIQIMRYRRDGAIHPVAKPRVV